jgi:SPP1 family predicted phage head-tail adaptor
MKAGELNKRISLQSSTPALGTFGDQSKTWTTYATVWAAIEPLNGRELEYAKSIYSEAQYKIVIRYSTTVASVSPTHRALYGSRIFEINAVQNLLEGNRQLTLFCKEIL